MIWRKTTHQIKLDWLEKLPQPGPISILVVSIPASKPELGLVSPSNRGLTKIWRGRVDDQGSYSIYYSLCITYLVLKEID